MKSRLWGIGVGIYVAVYVVGGAAWLYFAFFNPGVVPSSADTSFVPFVQWLFHHVVGAAPTAWSAAVAIGEFALAALLVSRKYRAAGLLLATLWQVFGAGVADGWPLGLLNLALGAGQVALLSHYWQSRRLAMFQPRHVTA
jgi:hypothetical protein